MNSAIDETRRKMEKTIKNLKEELAHIRTSRASVALLEGIKVDCYGTKLPIPQVATVNVVEGKMLVIQPWDPGLLKEIEKAIQKSDLGINPTSDGKVIRLVIPPLTEERRKNLKNPPDQQPGRDFSPKSLRKLWTEGKSDII